MTNDDKRHLVEKQNELSQFRQKLGIAQQPGSIDLTANSGIASGLDKVVVQPGEASDRPIPTARCSRSTGAAQAIFRFRQSRGWGGRGVDTATAACVGAGGCRGAPCRFRYRLAADQAAHRDLVSQKADIFQDRQNLAEADFLNDREDSAFLGGKVIRGLGRFGVQSVVGEIIERDTDRVCDPKGVIETRADFLGKSARFPSRSPARAGRALPIQSITGHQHLELVFEYHVSTRQYLPESGTCRIIKSARISHA